MNIPYDIETIKLIDGKISHKRNIHPFNEFNYNCISILVNLNNKKRFISNIFNDDDQKELISSIEMIETFKGKLNDSDISFIKKA